MARKPRGRRVSATERERIRAAILGGLAEAKATEVGADSPPGAAEGAPDGGAPTESALRDRTGRLPGLTAALGEDFMPLADECYETARQSDPGLRGMLDLNFELIADADEGLVEAVEMGEKNEIRSAEFEECIRETLLSTVFPAPGESGRESLRLTLAYEPEEPAVPNERTEPTEGVRPD
jgi:hypothetical protein